MKPIPLPARSAVLRTAAAAWLVVAGAALLPAQDTGGTPQLVERLTALLDEREGSRYWSTVHRLEELGDDAVPALREELDTGSEKTRLGVAKALLQIGGLPDQQAALRTLRELSQDASDTRIRVDAIQLYGRRGDIDEALEVLGGLLEETLDPQVTIALSRALWDIDRVPEARDRLVGLLESNDLDVRNEAALALAEMQYFEGGVREILRSLAKEPTAQGRRAALLDQVMRLSRQLDSSLSRGGVVLEGADPRKLLQVKEERIRELEDRLEELRGGSGGADRPLTEEDRLLEEVLRVVQQKYVDPEQATRGTLLLEAVKGLVRSLDQHSLFMDAKESREFTRSLDGNYPGVGAQVSKRPHMPLEIIRPIYGGPAYREGIHSGDRVVEVDGVETADLGMDRIMKLLKGPQGTTVELEIWRRGWKETRTFEIPRETIEVPSVYWERLPGDLGYLRLTQFGIQSAEEFRTALNGLEEKGIEGLLVDLRDNPGGRLPIAVRVADLFVRGELPIVTQKGRDGASDTPPYYPTDEARLGYPIVVLVNGHSASASEIVAGALQDYGRATLVGERTFGKGSVQNIIPLRSREGSQLKLTVQYYFLPLGRCIHTRRDPEGRVIEEGGVEPDIIVEPRSVPPWRLEARSELRTEEALLEYVDEHVDGLRDLVPLGDRGAASAYPEFGELMDGLDTPASEDDVRSAIRGEVRRRVEDRRGRRIAFDLQEDRQLQVAVLELLSQLGRDPAETPRWAWIPAFEPDTETAEGSGEVEEATDTPGPDSESND